MTGSLLPNGKQQFLDINGDPLVGGLVYFYIVNTLDPKDTYQNQALSILNTNPVILDARGQATIWGSGNYRQILKDAAGSTIWDKVTSGISGTLGNIFYTSNYPTLAAADAAAFAAHGLLVIDSAVSVSGSTSLLSQNTAVEGGVVTVSGSSTLTITGSISAGSVQWISLGNGSHVNLRTATGDAYPEWWGAVADVAGTLTGSGFNVSAGTNCTTQIQECWDYGPYVIRYSNKAAYLVTSLTRHGDYPHHHIFPRGDIGSVGFVGSGAEANYIAAITNPSAIEKGAGIKYVVQSGLLGTGGGFNDIFTLPAIVTTDFDHVIAFGMLYGGDGATRTVNFLNLEYPRFRGYIGLHIGCSDGVKIYSPLFVGMFAAIALEAAQVGTYCVVDKIDIYSPNFQQLINASGQIFYSKNYASVSPSIELQNVNVFGGLFEFGYDGIINDVNHLILEDIWMERVAHNQVVDTGNMVVNSGYFGGGSIAAALAPSSRYFAAQDLYWGANGPQFNTVGKTLQWNNGWLLANSSTVAQHRLGSPNNVTEGDGLLDIYGQNTLDTVFYAVAGTGWNAGATGLTIGQNVGTSRSINAAGTINQTGADCAEYRRLVERLWGAGTVSKGALLGVTVDGEYTDRWSEISGRVFIKTTRPHVVGNDNWGSEETICTAYNVEPINERHWNEAERICEMYNLTPVGDDPIRKPRSGKPDEDAESVQAYALDRQAWMERKLAFASALAIEEASYRERKAKFAAAYEKERQKWDRIAISGLVPCNVAASSEDVGKYLVPLLGANDTVTAVSKAARDLTFAEYISAIGVIERIGEDGRPLVNVKVT